MLIEYLLTKKADFFYEILIIVITIGLTYWYTEERNYFYYLRALVNEIKGNISQLSETEFNTALNEVLNRQRIWLAKGVSIKVASGTDEGYLYQYLLDHAYTIFVTKGYIIKLQNCDYVKGGTFGRLAEFYLNCNHFNRESFNYERNIVQRLSSGCSLNDSNPDVSALRGLRETYEARLNNNLDSNSVNFLENLIWDFDGKQIVIILVIVSLLIFFTSF